MPARRRYRTSETAVVAASSKNSKCRSSNSNQVFGNLNLVVYILKHFSQRHATWMWHVRELNSCFYEAIHEGYLDRRIWKPLARVGQLHRLEPSWRVPKNCEEEYAFSVSLDLQDYEEEERERLYRGDDKRSAKDEVVSDNDIEYALHCGYMVDQLYTNLIITGQDTSAVLMFLISRGLNLTTTKAEKFFGNLDTFRWPTTRWPSDDGDLRERMEEVGTGSATLLEMLILTRVPSDHRNLRIILGTIKAMSTRDIQRFESALARTSFTYDNVSEESGCWSGKNVLTGVSLLRYVLEIDQLMDRKDPLHLYKCLIQLNHPGIIDKGPFSALCHLVRAQDTELVMQSLRRAKTAAEKKRLLTLSEVYDGLTVTAISMAVIRAVALARNNKWQHYREAWRLTVPPQGSHEHETGAQRLRREQRRKESIVILKFLLETAKAVGAPILPSPQTVKLKPEPVSLAIQYGDEEVYALLAAFGGSDFAADHLSNLTGQIISLRRRGRFHNTYLERALPRIDHVNIESVWWTLAVPALAVPFYFNANEAQKELDSIKTTHRWPGGQHEKFAADIGETERVRFQWIERLLDDGAVWPADTNCVLVPSPLLFCVAAGREDLVRRLVLEAGCPVDDEFDAGTDCCHLATAHPANWPYEGPRGVTALSLAIRRGRLSLIKVLVEEFGCVLRYPTQCGLDTLKMYDYDEVDIEFHRWFVSAPDVKQTSCCNERDFDQRRTPGGVFTIPQRRREAATDDENHCHDHPGGTDVFEDDFGCTDPGTRISDVASFEWENTTKTNYFKWLKQFPTPPICAMDLHGQVLRRYADAIFPSIVYACAPPESRLEIWSYLRAKLLQRRCDEFQLHRAPTVAQSEDENEENNEGEMQ